VLAFVLTACGDDVSPPARVDDGAITDQQLGTTANVFKSVFDVQRQPCGETQGEGDTQEAACNRLALSALVLFRLADGYAVEHDIALEEQELTAAVDDFEASLGADILESGLAANGVTRDDLVEVIRASLLQDEVAKALAIEELGEDGLRAKYDEATGQHTVVQVDHVLVETEEEAREVHALVTADGADRDDFLALAKKRSTDPSAKQNGGALGSSYASTYVPEFAEAVLALEPGDISEPVQTQFGWHVIHMVDKEITPFEEVRDRILQSESTLLFVAWVRDQAQAGVIEVNPGFGRFDEQSLKIVRVSSTDGSAPAPADDPANAAEPEG
jgi:hypothetical protein